MSKLFLAASRVFGGGTVVALVLGCLLASGQQAQAASRVEVCPVPAYCSPLACKYSWLSDGTCFFSTGGGVASCDCLWP